MARKERAFFLFHNDYKAFIKVLQEHRIDEILRYQPVGRHFGIRHYSTAKEYGRIYPIAKGRLKKLESEFSFEVKKQEN